MLTGRFFHRMAPGLQTGTHYTINRLANELVQQRLSDFFPDWKAINDYEGLNGIDGLWLHNKHLPSRSVYNPITCKGKGLGEVELQFNRMIAACASSNSDAIARQAAYLSHVITDLCTPPHQHGRPTKRRMRRWYIYNKIDDDWQDDLADQALPDNHFKFEVTLFHRLIYAPLRVSRFNQRLVNRFYRTRHRKRNYLVRRYLKHLTKRIRSLNLYEEYIEFGWNRKVDRGMRYLVIPRIVSTVATIWYLAAKEGESRRLRISNFSIARHHPLISGKRL